MYTAQLKGLSRRVKLLGQGHIYIYVCMHVCIYIHCSVLLAAKALGALPPSESRDALINLCFMVLNRTALARVKG